MLFRNTYKAQLASDNGGWNDLATWLGLTEGELQISGAKSLKEITVYTCIKILSETLGKLPLKVYQDSGGIRKATDHYLYSLLKLRPNPYMSSIDFWRCLEVQRNIYGNAYAWLDFDKRGRVQGIYPLDSTRMQIYVDDVGLISSRQTVWYVYTDELGEKHKIMSDELLHFKGLSTNGLVGLSVIETLKNSIENAKASNQFLNNSYKKGMQSAGVLQYVGSLDENGRNALRKEFESMSSGLVNANRIAVMPLGVSYQSLGLKLTDAQFLENSHFTLQQLTAAFGIKPHQTNDQTKTSYASTSEANREFYTDTLLAILMIYEQELTYKLFLPSEIRNGYYARFNADVILRADQKTRYEAFARAIQSGFKTPNEVRAFEEDEPKDGGDDLYFNGNMIPITMAGKQYERGGNNAE